jgi:hypothetical protein
MPQILDPNTGVAVYVPGVYTKTQVRSSLAGPTPQFQTPVMLVGAIEGVPYNAGSGSLLVAGETDQGMFEQHFTAGAVAERYGRNSEAHIAMTWAKRHGLPFSYVVCMAALTRASVIVTSTGPVSQFTLHARRFGAPSNHIKLGYTGGVLTMVPIKNYALIGANVGTTDTRIYFAAEPTWAIVGKTIVIGANNQANASKAITAVGSELTASGQRRYWIELATAHGSALTTANYAMILEYDTAITATLASGQAIVDWFNTNPASKDLFIAVKESGFNSAVPITVGTALPLKEISAWGTVTKGTSPAPTSSDYDDFIVNMNAGGWARFAIDQQSLPRAYYTSATDTTSHGALRDYAVAERTRGYPISVTAGPAWGDVVIGAGDSTDPTFRAASLNSQDVSLWTMGLDRLGSNLSIAAAIFALRVKGGAKHNLTNDDLVFTEAETQWDEINSGELTTLCKKGVGTIKLSTGQTNRYRVSAGLSTLQRNASSWNEDDATTPLLMQRDLADFCDRVIKSDFEELLIGADEVDPNAIRAILNRSADKKLKKAGYAVGFSITSITLNATGTGYDVEWSITLPTTNDFITVITTILIGE